MEKKENKVILRVGNVIGFFLILPVIALFFLIFVSIALAILFILLSPLIAIVFLILLGAGVL